jgi:hypothetical protein
MKNKYKIRYTKVYDIVIQAESRRDAIDCMVEYTSDICDVSYDEEMEVNQFKIIDIIFVDDEVLEVTEL